MADSVHATSITELKPIAFASTTDILSYEKRLVIDTHLPGVRDVAMYTKDQLQAAVNFERNEAQNRRKATPWLTVSP